VPGLLSWVPDWSVWEDTYTLRWQEIQTTANLDRKPRASGVSSLGYSLGPAHHARTLILRGQIIAAIDVVAPLEPPAERVTNWREVRDFRVSSYAREWARDSIIQTRSRAVDSATSESMYTACISTYLGGHALWSQDSVLAEYRSAKRSVRLRRFAYRLARHGRLPNLFMVLELVLASGSSPGSRSPLCNWMEIVSYNRRMSRTDNGWLALVPGNTKQADKVVFLKGGKMGYVGRKRRDAAQETWGMLGEAYVHGVMNGKAWDEGACRAFQFT
jgi:hypothetical protein